MSCSPFLSLSVKHQFSKSGPSTQHCQCLRKLDRKGKTSVRHSENIQHPEEFWGVCVCLCACVFVCLCVCARARAHAHGLWSLSLFTICFEIVSLGESEASHFWLGQLANELPESASLPSSAWGSQTCRAMLLHGCWWLKLGSSCFHKCS